MKDISQDVSVSLDHCYLGKAYMGLSAKQSEITNKRTYTTIFFFSMQMWVLCKRLVNMLSSSPLTLRDRCTCCILGFTLQVHRCVNEDTITLDNEVATPHVIVIGNRCSLHWTLSSEFLVTNCCYKPGSILNIISTGDSKMPKLVAKG